MQDQPMGEDYHEEPPKVLVVIDPAPPPWWRNLLRTERGGFVIDLPDGAVMENGLKNQTTSADRLWGKSIIWGKDAEHATPYMTRYWIGRLRLHIFHRGDQDPDPHDHPWDFWTFPFTSYVEEVVEREFFGDDGHGVYYVKRRQVVPARRWTFRSATHTHRVLGRYDNYYIVREDGAMLGVVSGLPPVKLDERERIPVFRAGPIITLVWRSKIKRKWGFLKNRDGKWTPWKEYVFGGGKSAPCE